MSKSLFGCGISDRENKKDTIFIVSLVLKWGD